jgi:predicted O-methyltransferase YrrM
MNDKLASLLAELETFGKVNDAGTSDHARKMLNITRDTGEFLYLMARAVEARRILEIGTSNGYSTLWLAAAAQTFSGSVTTMEHMPFKAEMARANFERVALLPWIKLLVGDAGELLREQAKGSFGLVFLDADRSRYVAWWDHVQRVLALGGLLIVDNAISHANEMEPFVQVVNHSPNYVTSRVPVGNGELIILKVAN